MTKADTIKELETQVANAERLNRDEASADVKNWRQGFIDATRQAIGMIIKITDGGAA